MPDLDFDWSELQKQLETALRDSVRDVLEGTEADLRLWGQKLATDMVDVLRSGDEALRRELVEQVKALAEIQRLRLVGVQWQMIEKIVATALNVAGQLLSRVV